MDTETAPEDPAEINTAILRVIRDLPGIGKDSTGTGLNYSFRGIDDIMPHVERLFVLHGIVASSTYELIHREQYTSAHGASMHRVMLQGRFLFTAQADGSTTVASSIGEAADNSDKASNKAMTAAWKACLIQKLLINDGADGDTERPDGPVAVKPGNIDPSTVPNYNAWRALRPMIADAHLTDDLKVWAAENDIDATVGHDEPGVGRLVEHARALLVVHWQDTVAEGATVPLDPDTAPEGDQYVDGSGYGS